MQQTAEQVAVVREHSMVFLGYNIDTMGIVFMFLVGMIVLFIWHAHKYQDKFNVYDLIMENGHASKTGVVFMLAFLITSWVVVYQTLSGTLSDLVLGAYFAAWVTPVITRIAKGSTEEQNPLPLETPAAPPVQSNPKPSAEGV